MYTITNEYGDYLVSVSFSYGARWSRTSDNAMLFSSIKVAEHCIATHALEGAKIEIEDGHWAGFGDHR